MLAAVLVSLPVFLEAPLVRLAPVAALVLTIPLLAAGLALDQRAGSGGSAAGQMLVGFSGSWLAGALFWGWLRLSPVWHLPVESVALPLAIGGLFCRWRTAGAFYLASLAGTACTDGAMVLTGVMPLWPEVLGAPPEQAALLLHRAAEICLQPVCLVPLCGMALALIGVARQLCDAGSPTARIAASALITTVVVDGVFLLAAAVAPRLSGLI
jgi:hypothetical protein